MTRTRVIQQRFLKRPADEAEPSGGGHLGENFGSPVKLQCTRQQQILHQNKDLVKFSVAIVQNLKFTNPAALSQPQQSSTNIGFKTLSECVMQEPNNDFVDADQYPAALETDTALDGGTDFEDSSNLLGDDINDESISSKALHDLYYNISNDSDYELDNFFALDDKEGTMKVEDTKYFLQNQNNYLPPVLEKSQVKSRFSDENVVGLNPLAELKQTVEKHKLKTQTCLSFNINLSSNISIKPQQCKQFHHTSSNVHQQNPATSPHYSYSQQQQSSRSTPQYQESPMSSSMGSHWGQMGNPVMDGPIQHQQISLQQRVGVTIKGGILGEYNSNYGANARFGVPDTASDEGMGVSPGIGSVLMGGTRGNMGNVHSDTRHIGGISQQSDSYPISQKRSTNFTQQSRRRSGVPDIVNGGLDGSLNNMSGTNVGFGNNGPSTEHIGIRPKSGMGSIADMVSNTGIDSNRVLESNGLMVSNEGRRFAYDMGSASTDDLPQNTDSFHSGIQHIGDMSYKNCYPVSQTQTSNFTQQSRGEVFIVPNITQFGTTANFASRGCQQEQPNMGVPRLRAAQSLEQQQNSLLHQYQRLRIQQQYMAAAAVRYPPYETSAAGMMREGMPSMYVPGDAASPSVMTEVGEAYQPMHSSGSTILSNMYFLQQQQQQQHLQRQMQQRASIYSRQQAPIGVSMEPAQGHSLAAEWRRLVMTHQENNDFNNMRPNLE